VPSYSPTRVKGAGDIKAKIYGLWGTIEDTQRTKYEAALRSGCFKADGVRATEEEDMIEWLSAHETLISKIKDTYETEAEAEMAPMINHPEDVRGLIASLPSGYAQAMQTLKKTQATEKQLVAYQMEIQMAIVGAATPDAGVAAMKEISLKKLDWTKVDPDMEDLKQAVVTEYKLKEKQRIQTGGGSSIPTLALTGGASHGQTVNDPNGCYDCG
jgi:Spy/CpxP family protein refolding chaperone